MLTLVRVRTELNFFQLVSENWPMWENLHPYGVRNIQCENKGNQSFSQTHEHMDSYLTVYNPLLSLFILNSQLAFMWIKIESLCPAVLLFIVEKLITSLSEKHSVLVTLAMKQPQFTGLKNQYLIESNSCSSLEFLLPLN